MHPNQKRDHTLVEFIETLDLRRYFICHIKHDGTIATISETLLTANELEGEEHFSDLDKAKAYAHHEYTIKARQLHKQALEIWERPLSQAAKIWHSIPFLGNESTKQGMDDFKANMDGYAADKKITFDNFVEEKLTINVLPEIINTHQLLPQGTPLYWLRMDDILKGKEITIRDDVVSSFALREKGFASGLNAQGYSVIYNTESEGSFFVHDSYHGDNENELFYGSRNVRLFLTKSAAEQAVRELFAQTHIRYSDGNKENDSQTLLTDLIDSGDSHDNA